jgi:hypothetical protein
MKSNVHHGFLSRFARIGAPVAVLAATTGGAMAQGETSAVQTAISGLAAPIGAIIAGALVIGMLVVTAKLGYTVAKKFLS